MHGASSLDAAMQPSERYNAMFSKEQCISNLQNAGQKQKGRNPEPNSQKKSAKKGKPHYSGSNSTSISANNY